MKSLLPPLDKHAISVSTIMRAAQKAKGRGASPDRLRRYWNQFDSWSENADSRFWDQRNKIIDRDQWSSNIATDWFKKQQAMSKVRQQLSQLGVVDPNSIKIRLTRNELSPAYVHPRHAEAGPGANRKIYAPLHWNTLFHEAGHAVDLNVNPGTKTRRTALSPLGSPTYRERWKDTMNYGGLGDFIADEATTLRRESNAWRFGNQMMRNLNIPTDKSHRQSLYSTYELALLSRIREAARNSRPQLEAVRDQMPAKYRRTLDTMPIDA